MSLLRSVCRAALVASLALATVPAAQAQAKVDPVELTFWQSIQNSTNPAEYSLYLQTYPAGVFAKLAQVRLDSLGPAAAAAPPGQTLAAIPLPAAPVPEPDAADDGPNMTVTPASGKVGQRFNVGCKDFPQSNGRDQIVAVRVGTPAMDPNRLPAETKILGSGYADNCRGEGVLRDFGPFAPGHYEMRYMSVLWNDEHAYQVKAMVPFSVH